MADRRGALPGGEFCGRVGPVSGGSCLRLLVLQDWGVNEFGWRSWGLQDVYKIEAALGLLIEEKECRVYEAGMGGSIYRPRRKGRRAGDRGYYFIL